MVLFKDFLAVVDLKYLDLWSMLVNTVFRKCSSRSSQHNTLVLALSSLESLHRG